MKTTALGACFTAALSIASVAHAESLKVPETISGGVLNIRTGPGTNYALGACPVSSGKAVLS